jgi:large subunit ribosomal protein L25
VSPKDLENILLGEYRRNSIIKLNIDGTEELSMVKDLMVDPVTRVPLHADFYRITLDHPVIVDVPLRTEGRAKGVQEGGELNVIVRTVRLKTTADKIPAAVTVDVSSLGLDEGVTVAGLPLGDGVEALMPPDRRVILVAESRRVLEDETDTDADDSVAVAVADAPAD